MEGIPLHLLPTITRGERVSGVFLYNLLEHLSMPPFPKVVKGTVVEPDENVHKLHPLLGHENRLHVLETLNLTGTGGLLLPPLHPRFHGPVIGIYVGLDAISLRESGLRAGSSLGAGGHGHFFLRKLEYGVYGPPFIPFPFDSTQLDFFIRF